MIQNILEMLKHVEQYEDNEIIAIAKGKFELKKNYLQQFKDLLKWRLKK
jgi:hypothetical protein